MVWQVACNQLASSRQALTTPSARLSELAVGQRHLRSKLPAKLVCLNNWATHFCPTTAHWPPVTHFNFIGLIKWFSHWTKPVSIPSIRNDLISTVFNESYTWNILSILYWSLFANIDDELRINLNKVSLHYSTTCPVVIDKVQHSEISNALAMETPQSRTRPCNEKGFQGVNGLWAVVVLEIIQNALIYPSMELEIQLPCIVRFSANRFLMDLHSNRSCPFDVTPIYSLGWCDMRWPINGIWN